MSTIEYIFLNKIDYWEALRFQKTRVNELKNGYDKDILIFLEHKDIITIGRRGKEEEILVPPARLSEEEIEVVYSDRGGGLTAHGPGQLVIYAIFNLVRLNTSAKDLVSMITNAVKGWITSQGIEAIYDTEHPGLYIRGKKVFFIGLKLDKHITYHGFALNLNEVPKGFNYIIPCSMKCCCITSLCLETSKKYDIREVSCTLYRYICNAIPKMDGVCG